ncbi:pentatricopeptide repeat-containing protein At5g65560-like [Eutrema salsugineum]|uniref:pentatricopeptide repeat-containing protein At5g65560-like n=1 Tax=Eutrema salsugineum TaxID=72664 RepID=UPI000CED3913|nr:pentatricopeptide repeat-containing protein At5g65560-like [Eutrema salsugineum]
MRIPAQFRRRLFSSASVKQFQVESVLSALTEPSRQKTLVPSTTPSHVSKSDNSNLLSIFLSIDSQRTCQKKNPPSSLESFLAYVTPTDVSSLDLNIVFNETVSCYASILHVLTSYGIACHVPKTLLLMTTMCGSVLDSLFVVGFSRTFKSQLTPKCYNALLDLLARFELVHEMKRVYTDMLEQGMVLSRGTYTPNMMINAYCKLGYLLEARQFLCKMIQAALEVFKEMVDHGCAKGYENLILESCEIGNLEIAEKVLDQMLKEKTHPSEMVFKAILGCCCKLQKYEDAVKILEHVIRCGHSPQFEYCKMLVCGLFDRGDKERAESVIQKLLRSGFYDDELAFENWLISSTSD